MSDADTGKKRGRPAKFAGERTRGSLTVRLRDEVRSELERSAAQNGRSLSEEIEMRMEISLAQKSQLKHEWGEDVFRIASAMAASLSQIEDWTGSHWIEDEQTQQLFADTTLKIIENYKNVISKNPKVVPTGDLATMSNGELVQVFAALGGLAPPRPKKAPIEWVYTEED